MFDFIVLLGSLGKAHNLKVVRFKSHSRTHSEALKSLDFRAFFLSERHPSKSIKKRQKRHFRPIFSFALLPICYPDFLSKHFRGVFLAVDSFFRF